MSTPKDMPFDGALWGLKRGARMTRKGWNAPGQWVMLVQKPPSMRLFRRFMGYDLSTPISREATVEVDDIQIKPYFLLHNAQGHSVVWVPSTGDLLAEDWMEAP